MGGPAKRTRGPAKARSRSEVRDTVSVLFNHDSTGVTTDSPDSEDSESDSEPDGQSRRRRPGGGAAREPQRPRVGPGPTRTGGPRAQPLSGRCEKQPVTVAAGATETRMPPRPAQLGNLASPASDSVPESACGTRPLRLATQARKLGAS
jgi:hypothetical protein